MTDQGPTMSAPAGQQPKRRSGCLGCLGYLVLLAGLVVLGFWGYGQYNAYQAAAVEAERDREITEEMNRTALVNPKMGLRFQNETLVKVDPNGDLDQDGLVNAQELALGTSLDEPDSDDDGVPDGAEVTQFGSDPLKWSTAGDGVSDLVKVREKVDPRTKMTALREPFQVEYKELGVALRTSDPNSKHLHRVEPFHSQLVDELDSIRAPVIVRSFKGEVTVAYPDSAPNPADIRAYYYDLEQRQLVEIKGQESRPQERQIVFQNTADFPVLLRNRTNRIGAGREEPRPYYIAWWKGVPDFDVLPPYLAVVEISSSWVWPWDYQEQPGFVQFKVPAWWDKRFYRPLFDRLQAAYEQDTKGELREFLVVRLETMTPSELARYVADKHALARNAAAPKRQVAGVFDSGFQVSKHGFSFANMSTAVSTGGICAGFARVAEMLYNDHRFPPQQTWATEVTISDNGQQQFHYDWSQAPEAFDPILDLHGYDYRLSDTTLLSDLRAERTLDASRYGATDGELIKALELHFAKFNVENVVGFRNWLRREFTLWDDPRIIEKLKAIFQAGDVVTLGLMQGDFGHAITGYRLTQDEADPDVFYLDVYDNNFPNSKLPSKTDVRDRLRITLTVRRAEGLFERRDRFDFAMRAYGGIGSEKGGRLFVFKNGEPVM